MKRVCLLVFVSVLLGQGCTGSKPGSEKKSSSLLKAPIISYMVRQSGEGDNRITRLIHVFDYGRISVEPGKSVSERKYLPFSQKRAKALLDFIVKEQDFFSITAKDIEAFQKTRDPMMDAATTRIHVWCRKGSHTVVVYDFPDKVVKNKVISRLQKIVRRLENLRKELLNK